MKNPLSELFYKIHTQNNDKSLNEYHVSNRFSGMNKKLTKKPAPPYLKLVNEGKRTIHTIVNGNIKCVVRHNPEWNEYEVHPYVNGKHMGEDAVNYTDDLQDAIDTARHMANSELKNYMNESHLINEIFGFGKKKEYKGGKRYHEFNKILDKGYEERAQEHIWDIGYDNIMDPATHGNIGSHWDDEHTPDLWKDYGRFGWGNEAGWGDIEKLGWKRVACPGCGTNTHAYGGECRMCITGDDERPLQYYQHEKTGQYGFGDDREFGSMTPKVPRGSILLGARRGMRRHHDYEDVDLKEQYNRTLINEIFGFGKNPKISLIIGKEQSNYGKKQSNYRASHFPEDEPHVKQAKRELAKDDIMNPATYGAWGYADNINSWGYENQPHDWHEYGRFNWGHIPNISDLGWKSVDCPGCGTSSGSCTRCITGDDERPLQYYQNEKTGQYGFSDDREFGSMKPIVPKGSILLGTRMGLSRQRDYYDTDLPEKK